MNLFGLFSPQTVWSYDQYSLRGWRIPYFFPTGHWWNNHLQFNFLAFLACKKLHSCFWAFVSLPTIIFKFFEILRPATCKNWMYVFWALSSLPIFFSFFEIFKHAKKIKCMFFELLLACKTLHACFWVFYLATNSIHVFYCCKLEKRLFWLLSFFKTAQN